MTVRHGNMVVGTTATGKTTVSEVLAEALHNQVQFDRPRKTKRGGLNLKIGFTQYRRNRDYTG